MELKITELNITENDRRRQNMRSLAVKLNSGFPWSITKEGHSYWAEIHTKLEKYASGELKFLGEAENSPTNDGIF